MVEKDMVEVYVGVFAFKPMGSGAMISRLRKMLGQEGHRAGYMTITETQPHWVTGYLLVDRGFRAATAKEGWLKSDGVIKVEVERVMPRSETR